MKHIVFITDTWENTNGIVTWLQNVTRELETAGFKVTVIHPGLFFSLPMPTYPELKMAFFAKRKLEKIFREAKPDYIHIATNGTLGLSALRICKKNKWKFNTFYHTRLPEYIHARFGSLDSAAYAYFRWFHNSGAHTIVGTDSMKQILLAKGFKNVVTVSLGIDHTVFRPKENPVPLEMPKPIFVYLGRIAVEKNIEAFLSLNLPGSKLVIGDGPARAELEQKYSDAKFIGYKTAPEIAEILSASDVLVFPSRTDTFGLVMVEAMACGLPVAAFDVPGPRDIVTDGVDGFLGENLEENARKCLALKKEDCIRKASRFSWQHTAQDFIDCLTSSGLR